MPPPFPPHYPPLPEEEMELSSGEESEYESGDDEDKERCGPVIRTYFCVNSFMRQREPLSSLLCSAAAIHSDVMSLESQVALREMS